MLKREDKREITEELFENYKVNTSVQCTVKDQSVWQNIVKELRSNKVAMVSLVLLLLLLIVVLLAPLSPYDPYKLGVSQKLQGISTKHWFGTDEYGRDYFTRTLYGGRVSLTVGFLSMIMTVVIGTSIGVLSGYVGGKIDAFLMSFTGIFLALPSMLLMVILNTFLKPGLATLIVVLSLFSWASVARITRAETMSLKERDFVLASKHRGASHAQIIFVHIIPNMSSSVIVAGSLAVARAILTESALSFMGLGVQLPKASWGTMLQGAQVYIMDMPLLAVFPGVFVVLTVFSFNILGDALRNALEPKMIK